MSRWQLLPSQPLPPWFLEAVENYHSQYGKYAAQLLWHRGIRHLEQLEQFINPNAYSPTSGATGFGRQMDLAIQRLQQAWERRENVSIWGDFDADGITATSVLWEGLQPFFPETLSYYIPNRLSESHGLNEPGLEQLAAKGISLIITCDTGSTNLKEIETAKTWGMDVIVTDHHTLPEEEPAVVSILNPKYLAPSHPLYHLSGVAVAYKLIESLYEAFPHIPNKSSEELLDLVAIGLVADLVELKGDCRYLAQKGIKKLAQQRNEPTRPGIAELLKLCQRTGDRPMDISFGIGPRINAISRIQGDASFAVKLLTSEDETTCQQLAQETEAANTRRKELQKEMEFAVKRRIEQLDLSTTGVIVLADSQWHPGILGLVAGQIAQTYARPTILFSLDSVGEEGIMLARGSARSVQEIDLYELLRSQTHLLASFGGHPFAAGLSLNAENLPLFREAINQQFRQTYGTVQPEPTITIDLTVTVQELGQALFQALKLLEPYGMGNPMPRLLIKNCWFRKVWHQNIKDNKGRKIRYIRTTFEICDETKPEGCSGMWWGHYKDELPENEWFDAVVELEFNAYEKRYEVRLVEVKPRHQTSNYQVVGGEEILLLDQRKQATVATGRDTEFNLDQSVVKIQNCPRSWQELHESIHQRLAQAPSVEQEVISNSDTAQQSAIALAYSSPQLSPTETWKQLLGIAAYLTRTGKTVPKQDLQTKLALSEQVLAFGLDALNSVGFEVAGEKVIEISGQLNPNYSQQPEIQLFLDAVQEEQFRCEYFSQVSLETITHQTSFLRHPQT